LYSKPQLYAQQKFADNCLLNNFSPDGKQIVSASADKSLKLWDLAGNCLQTFVGHTDEVLSANFSPDGKQIVSASMEICIWQLSPAQSSLLLMHTHKSELDNYLFVSNLKLA
jgi:WD40 repeat protein